MALFGVKDKEEMNIMFESIQKAKYSKFIEGYKKGITDIDEQFNKYDSNNHPIGNSPIIDFNSGNLNERLNRGEYEFVGRIIGSVLTTIKNKNFKLFLYNKKNLEELQTAIANILVIDGIDKNIINRRIKHVKLDKTWTDEALKNFDALVNTV
jgi:hypothetical protein